MLINVKLWDLVGAYGACWCLRDGIERVGMALTMSLDIDDESSLQVYKLAENSPVLLLLINRNPTSFLNAVRVTDKRWASV